MLVLKFGGSSLASVANLRNVLQVIRQAAKKGKMAVVVSAVGGVTDDLVAATVAATRKEKKIYQKCLKEVTHRHEILLPVLSSSKRQQSFKKFQKEILEKISISLDGITTVGECTPRTRDGIIGCGEVLSAHLISQMLGSLSGGVWDTRTLIVTDDAFGQANVLFEKTDPNLMRAWRRQGKGRVPVVTGFIGATENGLPTTLGRNGSDYTAAIVGAALQAKEIQIWTDVDGVMSADPKRVPGAFVLPRVSYAEALEMAYFGAKVVHPKTMTPAMARGIPILIKNTLRPEVYGTEITCKTDLSGRTVKTVTVIENLALMSLEGNGMMGVPGMASRLFGAMARADVNVVMISQASSEHSICFVIQKEAVRAAKKAMTEEFARELDLKTVEGISVQENVAIVAAIGEGMKGTPGISGKLFGALGKNKINILAVAQGSSEMNISLVVAQSEATKALNVIHGAFHLSAGNVHLIVIGKGTVGGKLLEQLSQNQARLLKEYQLCLKVIGITDSKKFLWRPEGIILSRWEKDFTKQTLPWKEREFVPFLEKSGLENLIVVDATASENIASLYTELLKHGISVVTPNKKANTFSSAFYHDLQKVLKRRHSFYLYETTVGAGLPVISTLQDLIKSGDEILEIQGIFSGTLSYLFSEMENGTAISSATEKAQAMGFTEPDPREDLSGTDVARKILILARELGYSLELKDVRVENLVPKQFRNRGTIATFLKGLKKEDLRYKEKIAAAAKKGYRLRYVAELKNGHCQVGIKELRRESPLARLRSGDNIVIYKTRRYFKNPLIVQGPGAGPDVTAAGIFADILKVANLLTRES